MSLPPGARFGFHGGNSIWELGSQRDMVVFFACLDRLARPSLSEAGRFVLFDRLFKRYLRPEDLDEAVSGDDDRARVLPTRDHGRHPAHRART